MCVCYRRLGNVLRCSREHISCLVWQWITLLRDAARSSQHVADKAQVVFNSPSRSSVGSAALTPSSAAMTPNSALLAHDARARGRDTRSEGGARAPAGSAANGGGGGGGGGSSDSKDAAAKEAGRGEEGAQGEQWEWAEEEYGDPQVADLGQYKKVLDDMAESVKWLAQDVRYPLCATLSSLISVLCLLQDAEAAGWNRNFEKDGVVGWTKPEGASARGDGIIPFPPSYVSTALQQTVLPMSLTRETDCLPPRNNRMVREVLGNFEAKGQIDEQFDFGEKIEQSEQYEISRMQYKKVNAFIAIRDFLTITSWRVKITRVLRGRGVWVW